MAITKDDYILQKYKREPLHHPPCRCEGGGPIYVIINQNYSPNTNSDNVQQGIFGDERTYMGNPGVVQVESTKPILTGEYKKTQW